LQHIADTAQLRVEGNFQRPESEDEMESFENEDERKRDSSGSCRMKHVFHWMKWMKNIDQAMLVLALKVAAITILNY